MWILPQGTFVKSPRSANQMPFDLAQISPPYFLSLNGSPPTTPLDLPHTSNPTTPKDYQRRCGHRDLEAHNWLQGLQPFHLATEQRGHRAGHPLHRAGGEKYSEHHLNLAEMQLCELTRVASRCSIC